jgi:hypothetical protein
MKEFNDSIEGVKYINSFEKYRICSVCKKVQAVAVIMLDSCHQLNDKESEIIKNAIDCGKLKLIDGKYSIPTKGL